MPGFYHHPRGIDDLVGHVVGKVLDRLGIENHAGARWAGREVVEERMPYRMRPVFDLAETRMKLNPAQVSFVDRLVERLAGDQRRG